jgi:hypothetical protein
VILPITPTQQNHDYTNTSQITPTQQNHDY